MNHSKAFWAVRNQYADQMRSLWSRQYTGEGLWGRGALLSTGEFERNTIADNEVLPEHLCGGTYRSRGRKRKAKTSLTYKEREERRILKKFGRDGVALGEDSEAKANLEKGRHIRAKPRVAGSARGRELRAAAALARFDQQKKEKEKEEEVVGIKDEDETASEADSETDGYEDGEEGLESGGGDALDMNGKRILDGKGRGMIKVCEDENPDDQDARRERLELQSPYQDQGSLRTKQVDTTVSQLEAGRPRNLKEELPGTKVMQSHGSAPDGSHPPGSSKRPSEEPPAASSKPPPTVDQSKDDGQACPICSFANDRLSVTCGMCSHVLNPADVPNAWQCQSAACNGSLYRNAGDCGVCGICGERRLASVDRAL